MIMSDYRILLRVIGPENLLIDLRNMAEEEGLMVRFIKISDDRVDQNIDQVIRSLVIPLAQWERPGVHAGDDRESILSEQLQQLSNTSKLLKLFTPLLLRLGGSEITKSLYCSTIRYEDQGGFEIPLDIVRICAQCGLFVEISIEVGIDY